MYERILVPLENSAYDAAIVRHVCSLARITGARVLLIHVADGWVARNIQQLKLRESEEMRDDRAYLERIAAQVCDEGIDAEAILAAGDPATEISETARREKCDLIAMATHGHGFVKDLVFGSVVYELRHLSVVPILLVHGSADD
jgi:nucleotide-binding universal stress UspA family protein